MSDLPPKDEQRKVFTVGQINRAVRLSVEDRWNDIWVQGELSDVHQSGAGHIYFSLNDEKAQAQLRGVMFRGDRTRARTTLENGARVELGGGLSLFEPRGQFQFIARKARAIGEGDLAARFAAIRKKLEAEGLFDADRKRTLPFWPRTIGVVTSAQGAALQDVIRVASERAPVRIVVADCRVQGQTAPTTIVKAIEQIQKLEGLDAVIVTRGGGSAEDLWAFNEEIVARAIASCIVPTVSGIGHEVDVTIADLVADVRAATPSNAAEILVPEKNVLLEHIYNFERRLVRAMEALVDRQRLRLEQASNSLNDPRYALSGVRGKLASYEQRLVRATYVSLANRRAAVTTRQKRLSQHDPRARLEKDRARWLRLDLAIAALGARLVADRRARFANAVGQLDALSPLAVLQRGYAIALHHKSGKTLTSSSDASVGDSITVKLAKGSLDAEVSSVS